jgi:hypothetical protein
MGSFNFNFKILISLYNKTINIKGTTKENGLTSDLLLNVKLTVYNSTSCKNVATTAEKNWSAQVCAGNINEDSLLLASLFKKK